MSNKKVVKSAVCIIPPTELWEDIQELRKENDKAYARWPPHINLLYPFVPVEEFATVAPKLAKAVESISPFVTTFENFSYFPHGTIFCDPQTKIEKSIGQLQSALESAVPYCNDQSAKAGGFHPHLTVGQVQPGETADSTIVNYLKFWNPIQFNVDRVYLIAREGDEPFKIHYQVFLKDGKFEAVDIPYTTEEKKKDGAEEEDEKEDKKTMQNPTGYQVGPSHARVSLEVPAALIGASATSSQKQLLFVLDISGSMYDHYAQVKEAVNYMIETKPALEPLFIVFDHAARRATAAEIQKISATGGTLFTAAIDEINKLLGSGVVEKNLEIACVFMTDGQDGDKSKLPASIAKMKELSNMRSKAVTVHTIAFGTSADLNFLNTIRAIGAQEGMMRHVKDNKLTGSFAEIFDFLDLTKTFKLTLATENGAKLEREVDGEMKKVGYEDYVSLDLVYGKSTPEYQFFTDKGVINAQIGDHMLDLPKLDADIFFNLRGVEAMEILTQEQLVEAQTFLQNTNALKAPRSQRQEAVEMKAEIQEQLNKFHQAFADIARGAYGTTSTLQSLRYDFKFNKSRRVRTMNQRATKNAAVFAAIEKKLASVKLSDEELSSFSALDYTCPLSGDSVSEVMTGSPNDVMVFALRVSRPEHAIDAPTEVQINDILAGTYSNYAFQQSMAFALRKGNAAAAHGGFNENNAENVGFFKGPDGKFMNACLPLYINEHHWKRVEIQLEPMLGYFFTLDPLGFKGDQYLALFMILGNMLMLREQGNFKSEWADWVIEDFRKLCTAVKPKVIKYLKSGFYANGLLKEDPLDAFMASPAGRTKQVLQNIMVIVGWADVSEGFDKEKFKLAFVEEVWRRNFTNYYKAQPREIVMSTIEKLIYGPPDDADPNKQLDGLVKNKLNKNDKQFVLWAEWKLGKASKRKAEEISKTMKDGPEIEGTLSPDTGYTSRQVVEYDVHKDLFKAIVDEELGKINDRNKYFEKYTGGAIMGNFAPKVQWVLMLQSLQFCSNDLVNSGVASGTYKNSIEYLDRTGELLQHQHEFFDKHRRENYEGFIRDKNNLTTAHQVVATKDIWAFIGRMMKSCPTRGGPVFDAVVAYLHSPPLALSPVPLHAQKIEILFTGKFKQADEPDLVVLSEGSAWVHCPEEMAKKFKAAMGEDKFALMEAQLHGHWGWVYRSSDIPNRHGHCNSNPNPLLSKDFTGFGV